MLRQKVAGWVKKVENSESFNQDDGIPNIQDYPIELFIPIYKEYTNHPSIEVKRWVYSRITSCALQTQDITIKRKFIEEYLEAGLKNTGIEIISIIHDLKRFSQDDFTDLANEMMYELYLHYPTSNFFQLAGIANNRLFITTMKNFPNSDESASMALARMGDKEEIEKQIKVIENEVLSSKRERWLAKLAYIRQPEAVEKMIEYVYSDLQLLDWNHFTGPFYKPINNDACKYLDEMIEDIPYKAKNIRYSDLEVKFIQEWLKVRPKYRIKR